jgi:hypothetical protein
VQIESQGVLTGVPVAAAPLASEQTQKFSLFALTMMVVGSMVGAGIFSLPRAFGSATGAFGAIVVDHRGWRHVHAGAGVPGAGRA